MKTLKNIPLKDLTTMKLGGNASFIAEVYNQSDVVEACNSASSQKLPIFVLGGGSNIIARDEGFNGIIIHIHIPGFEVIDDDVNCTTIKIGAGENWDSVVERTVGMQLSGIEAMSAIPGTAGATPVQNVGAYGQEIADTLQSLTAYDTKTNTFVELTNADCEFTYRYSIFRGASTGRYIITAITLKLSKKQPEPPFYNALQSYLDKHNITTFDVKTIRDAIIEIRKNKLPDPMTLPNTGSFFKNAVVGKQQMYGLRAIDSDIPVFEMNNGSYKIPSGWLIEHAGLKGKLIHGMRVYDKNALVLVNESAESYNDLALARDEIIKTVHDTFQVQIQQEPLEI
ncbi:MAG: UDP-N-acetylmuramate dehydrogenase [Candidatus Saccharibacteria bacterium]